nr:cytochrome oxidase biogenesis protein Sco1/SenC/PrrC, putative copper metallochaperone [uncultured bacterium]
MFEVAGLVQSVDPVNAVLTVEHEEVPGFMPAMTMPFTARESEEIVGIKAGDAIRFDLIVTADDSWIQRISPIDRVSLKLPEPGRPAAPAKTQRLKEGDQLPAFSLTDQGGRTIEPATFAGKNLLLTFIFTRCPIPNFCPLMSQNFETLEKEIQRDPALADQVRLLSISFDPEYDTPEVLAGYAKRFTEDGAFWRFATGTPAEVQKLTSAFSVYVQPEGGTISHGLTTALVDPTGRITKIWRGNGWQTAEVMAALKSLPAPLSQSTPEIDPDQVAGGASARR